MDLSAITPLVLVYNEEANIGRTLARLTWADDIVVVDSHSTDDTLEVVNSFPQVRIVSRSFDNFANQYNFGLEYVDTEWVLPLDADYVLSESLIEELDTLHPEYDIYIGRFIYCVFGVRLRRSLYPPRPILFRRKKGRYVQDGHTQRLDFEGSRGRLKAPVFHDDRKSLDAWLEAQRKYALAETEKLREIPRDEMDFLDYLRAYYLAPLLILPYCLFWKGLLFEGRPGLYYSLQRTYAELLLALSILDTELRTDLLDDKEDH